MKKMNNIFYKNKPSFALFLLIVIITRGVAILQMQEFGNMLNSTQNFDMNAFSKIIILLIIVVLIGIIFKFISKYFENRYKRDVIVDAKTLLFSSMIKKPIKNIKNENAPEFFSSFINDMNIAENNYFNSMIDIIILVTGYVVTIAYYLYVSPIIAIIVVILSIIPLLIPIIFESRLQSRTASFIIGFEKLTQKIKEYLSGYEVIRSFSLENKIFNNYKKYEDNLEKVKFRSEYFEDFVNGASTVASFFVLTGTLVTGMFLALNGIITFGQIISLTMISGGISDVAIGLGRNIINIRSSKPIIDKFNKSLEKETLKDKIDIKYINSISTEDLNVEFESNVVLNDVSIRFDESKKYAIIGSSGSGKSTLVNSLLSFNDYSGNVYINDCELKKINKTSFYELISYIPQKSFIIEGTIKDNLNFYDDYSEEELNEVIKIVNLQDKIESLPEGLNTYIGEDGNMLSGGEKQRINIARAILRKKLFFILDEFTSALDNANSASIENYMLSLKDACIISITHRLNEELLKLYDEIIFMHNGSIVEKGKFDYLMEKRGYFYAMFNSLEN